MVRTTKQRRSVEVPSLAVDAFESAQEHPSLFGSLFSLWINFLVPFLGQQLQQYFALRLSMCLREAFLVEREVSLMDKLVHDGLLERTGFNSIRLSCWTIVQSSMWFVSRQNASMEIATVTGACIVGSGLLHGSIHPIA
jgi:hypothetical protein